MAARTRLDLLLVERGLAPSRERARALPALAALAALRPDTRRALDGRSFADWLAAQPGRDQAVAGSAVGLGNFLRFPGQAAQNGGGAFMIPYFCALLFLGIPIGWAEWTMGRYGGRKGFHSAPSIMGVVGGGAVARYLGVIGVLIPLGVSFYYTYIEAWCLGYTWMYVTGGIGSSAANEGFTTAYDLPNDAAYAETCAAIGLAFWSAMTGLSGTARSFPVERKLQP